MNSPRKMVPVTAAVDLDALAALKERLEICNNGYTRKEYLSKELRGQIPHLVALGLAVETWSHLYTPEGYDCAMRHNG